MHGSSRQPGCGAGGGGVLHLMLDPGRQLELGVSSPCQGVMIVCLSMCEIFMCPSPYLTARTCGTNTNMAWPRGRVRPVAVCGYELHFNVTWPTGLPLARLACTSATTLRSLTRCHWFLCFVQLVMVFDVPAAPRGVGGLACFTQMHHMRWAIGTWPLHSQHEQGAAAAASLVSSWWWRCCWSSQPS